MKNQHIGFLATLLASTFLTAPALAQTAQSNAVAPSQTAQAAPTGATSNILEEVVVTSARSRSEDVQSTPVAVTALSPEILDRAHVTSVVGLSQLAPNLQISQTVSQGDEVSVYLRGFGAQTNDPSVEPHVSVYIDGIYQPALLGGLVDLFDVSQVEVDAGPQGTLFGKNAAIGAISITTAKPTGDFSGKVEADYGSYDHVGVRGVVNVPIVKDVLAAKFSFVEKEGGNWIYNTFKNKYDEGGENAKVGRLAILFTPNDVFTWNLVASLDNSSTPQIGDRQVAFQGAVAGNGSTVAQNGQTICAFYPNGVCPLTAYGTNSQAFTDRNEETLVEVSSNMSYRFTPVTLTSVTGFYHNWDVNNSGVSGTPFYDLNSGPNPLIADQESEDFRISSNKGGGWDLDGFLDWVVGGYYSNFDYTNSNSLAIPLSGAFFAPPLSTSDGRDLYQQQHGTNISTAVFAHVIFNFTDQWTGTFGVRQSWDQKMHDYIPIGGTPQSGAVLNRYYDTPAGFHNTSFEVGTAYQFDESHMAYVRFAQGYQAGGFLGFPGSANGGASYQPELNNEYEVGFKSDWLDKRLRVNLDFFINELSQLQVEGVEPSPTAGFIQTVTNAGSATVEGAEAQIIAVPTDRLTTHLDVGYLKTRYNKYLGTSCSNTGMAADCSGIPFEYAPRWTMDLGGDYVLDLPSELGTATFSADWNYRSTAYYGSPPIPASKQEGYGLVNAGLKFTDPSEMYSLEFYGTNILDRRYKLETTDAGSLSLVQDDGRPAEWGLRLTAKF